MNEILQSGVIQACIAIVTSIALFVVHGPLAAYALSADDVVVRTELVETYPDGAPLRTAFTAYNQEAALTLQSVGDVAAHGTTTVRVSVDPGQESVNAVSLYLKYPTTSLSLMSINDTDTAFAFSFVEYVDLEAGIVAVHYMQPYPGVSEYARVTDLVFNTLASGTSSIEFLSQSQVAANDGRGTNVLTYADPLTLVID